MKESPILYQSQMVWAIWHDMKTKTRRVMSRQPPHEGCEISTIMCSTGKSEVGKHEWVVRERPRLWSSIIGSKLFVNPYGVQGDRLWVREDFRFHKDHDGCRPSSLSPLVAVNYPATNHAFSKGEDISGAIFPENWGRLRPSIHMPRWASPYFA